MVFREPPRRLYEANNGNGLYLAETKAMTEGFPGGSVVKKKKKIFLPIQEIWVRSLGQEDPLEKEMATHPNILPWEIPWTKEPGVLQSMRLQRVRHDLVTKQ